MIHRAGSRGYDASMQSKAKTGKRLDMGTCCVRFRQLEELPVDLIAESVRRVPLQRFISLYEVSIGEMRVSKVRAARSH